MLEGVGEIMPDSVWNESSSGGDALFADLYGLTMLRTYHGARRVIVATHGVGGVAALPNLTRPAIDTVLLASTISQTAEFVTALTDRLTILNVSDDFAQTLNDKASDKAPSVSYGAER